MGRKDTNGSLTKQVQTALEAKLRIGESKYQAKKDGTAQDGIYSWSTFRTYMKHANYFTDFCKKEHKCKTLDDCRPFVDEYLATRTELSPYTQKLEAAALAKLYSCSTTDFVETATRNRDNITRSRGAKVRDAHFSESKNQDFVDFCKGTGLRRAELHVLTGDRLVFKDGKPYIHLTRGTKGGRPRFAPITGNVEKIVALMQNAGTGKVFAKVPGGADIHGYRSDYATAIYKENARDYKTCLNSPFWNPEHSNGAGKPKGGYDKNSLYWLRGSQKGKWLDKEAMMEASKALGHSRISIVGEHYIQRI